LNIKPLLVAKPDQAGNSQNDGTQKVRCESPHWPQFQLNRYRKRCPKLRSHEFSIAIKKVIHIIFNTLQLIDAAFVPVPVKVCALSAQTQIAQEVSSKILLFKRLCVMDPIIITPPDMF
jgi:hypothetical protein